MPSAELVLRNLGLETELTPAGYRKHFLKQLDVRSKLPYSNMHHELNLKHNPQVFDEEWKLKMIYMYELKKTTPNHNSSSISFPRKSVAQFWNPVT